MQTIFAIIGAISCFAGYIVSWKDDSKSAHFLTQALLFTILLKM